MDKTLNDMVKDIKRASKHGKLIAFIGAGISVNSGYKLWDKLIGIFNHDNKYSDKSSGFSTDEALKIPQYYYNENNDAYFDIIKQEYDWVPEKTNSIIDELLKLKPNHIVTTNFDMLIEKSIREQHVYGNTVYGDLDKYSIIRSDDDFVTAKKNNYLIKMHGDVNALSSIVLKEEDYLSYSYTHTLIETFIKSLLINHTFIFAGYGLGDYNLKLIMSWVDSILLKQKDAIGNNRMSYYFINADDIPLNYYIKEYYRNKNIYVLEASELPANFEMPRYAKKIEPLDDQRGNNIIRVLQYIKYGTDSDILEISRDLALIDKLNCITLDELFTYLDYYHRRLGIYNNVLRCSPNNLPLKLEAIINELKYNDKSEIAKTFKSVFSKAGITKIIIEDDSENEMEIFADHDDRINCLYQCVIECNLAGLLQIKSNASDNVYGCLLQAFISAILGEYDEANALLNKVLSPLRDINDIYHYLICLYNISQVDTGVHVPWYILIQEFFDEDKTRYKTLYDYLEGFYDLFVTV